MTDSVEQGVASYVIGQARGKGLELAPREVAEVLWLRHQWRDTGFASSPEEESAQSQDPAPSQPREDDLSSRQDGEAASGSPDPEAPATSGDDGGQAEAAFADPEEQTAGLGAQRVTAGVAPSRPLRQGLDFARAFHRLAATRPSPVERSIDVSASVKATAAARGQLQLVFRSLVERATHLVMIQDKAATMLPWRDQRETLVDLACEVGSFAGVDSAEVDLSADGPLVFLRRDREVTLRSLCPPGRDPLVLLISDGLGRAAVDGRLGLCFQEELPPETAVAWVHPWIEGRWKRTPVARLRLARIAGEGVDSRRVVPVVALEPQGLANLEAWAHHRGTGPRNGRQVPLPRPERSRRSRRASTGEVHKPEAVDWMEEARRLCAQVEQPTIDLLGLCAAVPGVGVDLELMRALADRFVRRGETARVEDYHFAEALSSGFLRLDEASQGARVVLGFPSPEARQSLLGFIDHNRIAEVLQFLVDSHLQGDGDGLRSDLQIPVDLLVRIAGGGEEGGEASAERWPEQVVSSLVSITRSARSASWDAARVLDEQGYGGGAAAPSQTAASGGSAHSAGGEPASEPEAPSEPSSSTASAVDEVLREGLSSEDTRVGRELELRLAALPRSLAVAWAGAEQAGDEPRQRVWAIVCLAETLVAYLCDVFVAQYDHLLRAGGRADPKVEGLLRDARLQEKESRPWLHMAEQLGLLLATRDALGGEALLQLPSRLDHLDPSFERAILGAILLDPDALRRAQEKGLQVNDFLQPSHRLIFECFRDLFREGKPIDMVTVGGRLEEQATLDTIGGYRYLTGLSTAVPRLADLPHYISIVREKKAAGILIANQGANLETVLWSLVELRNRTAHSRDEPIDDSAGDLMCQPVWDLLAKLQPQLEAHTLCRVDRIEELAEGTRRVHLVVEQGLEEGEAQLEVEPSAAWGFEPDQRWLFDENRPVLRLLEELPSPGIEDAPSEETTPAVVFHVPPRSGGHVVVEAARLEEVHRLLHLQPPHVGRRFNLYGTNASGKTQLALEYAHRYKQHYPDGVVCLNAGLSREDEDLASLAVTALGRSDSDKLEDLVEAAREWLESHHDYLLVLDNVGTMHLDGSDLDRWLPGQSRARVLAISHQRLPGFSGWYGLLQLSVHTGPGSGEFVDVVELCPRDARALLCSTAGIDLPQPDSPLGAVVAELCEELSCLPVALELAGAYLQNYQVSLDDYLQQVRAKAWEFHDKRRGKQQTDDLLRPEPEVSIAAVLAQDSPRLSAEPETIAVVEVLALWGQPDVGLELLALMVGAATLDELRHSVAAAESHRLLRLDEDLRVRVNPFVQRVLRGNRSVEQGKARHLKRMARGAKRWLAADNAARTVYGGQTEAVDAEWKGLVALATWVREAQPAPVLEWPKFFLDLADSLEAPGVPLHRVEEALEFAQKALAIYQQNLGEEHEDTAKAYQAVGALLNFSGRFDEALHHVQKVLAIRRKVLGDEHPDTAAAYRAYADELRGSHPDVALEFEEKALEIYRKALGEEHLDTARAYTSMGLTWSSFGRHEDALECHQSALEIYRKTLGEEDPETLDAYYVVRAAFDDVDGDEELLSFEKETLAIRRKVQGDEHPETATALANLGGTLSGLGDFAGARELEEEALAIRRKVLGDEHPDTVSALGNLGVTLRELGDLAGARELEEEALAISRKVLGDEHPDTARALGSLGVTLRGLGDLAGARELEEEALAISRKVLGDEHPDPVQAGLDPADGLQDRLQELEMAVAAGDAEAMRELGSRLLEGSGLGLDSDRGLRLFEQAVALDDGRASYELGHRLVDGDGLPVDAERGYRLLLRAFEGGEVDAGVRLAESLRRGEGRCEDWPTVHELLAPALSDNSFNARIQQALCLASGFGCAVDWVAADHTLALPDEEPGAEWRQFDDPWIRAMDRLDAEGSLVQGWLLRHGHYAPIEDHNFVDLLKEARDGGWAVPDWMLEPPTDLAQSLDDPADPRALERAALAGEVEAMLEFGNQLLDGKFTPVDSDRGQEFLEQAVAMEHPEAMVSLADRLFQGWGLPKDWDRSLLLLEQAVAMEYPVAMVQLADRLFAGFGLPVDSDRGLLLLEQAVAIAYPQAMCQLAFKLFEGLGMPVDSDRGRELLEEAVAMGDPNGMMALGRRLLEGNGVPEDSERALLLYEQAVEQGDPQAMYTFGYDLLEGMGVPVDSERGLRLLEQAAEHGQGRYISTVSMVELGERLLDGRGVPVDSERGLSFFEQAAATGEVRALHQLGRRFLEGRGVPADPERGQRLLLQSHERGDARGGALLAGRLRRGEWYGLEPQPSVHELLSGGFARNSPVARMEHALCLAAGHDCEMDWATADAGVAELAPRGSGAAASVDEAWASLVEGEEWNPKSRRQAEQALVWGWLLRHGLIDEPEEGDVFDRLRGWLEDRVLGEKPTAVHLLQMARDGGWAVPDWMLELPSAPIQMDRMDKEAAMAALDAIVVEVPTGKEPWLCHAVDHMVFGSDAWYGCNSPRQLIDLITYADPWLYTDEWDGEGGYHATVDELEEARRTHGDELTEALRTRFNEVLEGQMEVRWWGVGTDVGAEYPDLMAEHSDSMGEPGKQLEVLRDFALDMPSLSVLFSMQWQLIEDDLVLGSSDNSEERQALKRLWREAWTETVQAGFEQMETPEKPCFWPWDSEEFQDACARLRDDDNRLPAGLILLELVAWNAYWPLEKDQKEFKDVRLERSTLELFRANASVILGFDRERGDELRRELKAAQKGLQKELPRWFKLAAWSAAGAAAGGWGLALAAPLIGGTIGASMGLAGAAATAHGLAVLGGGALAAGGSGMAGGIAVLMGGGAVLGMGIGGGAAVVLASGLAKEAVLLASSKLEVVVKEFILGDRGDWDQYQAVLAAQRRSIQALEEQIGVLGMHRGGIDIPGDQQPPQGSGRNC